MRRRPRHDLDQVVVRIVLLQAVRKGNVLADSILIRVTDLFGLHSEEVPLPAAQHFEHRERERTDAEVVAGPGDIAYPHKADDDVGDLRIRDALAQPLPNPNKCLTIAT
jgi:hypothetical protein